MASLTIRNLDNGLKARLRLQAAQHGRSMEAEVRQILQQSLLSSSTTTNFAAHIHQRFKSVYQESLPIPPRQQACKSSILP
ncbi:MAG: hypothetical protein FD174_356 [Geobacteraceae bacterium]|nr:MAG: hypothetical protein FD174_356 [Geobacteraceae bacterium]